MKLKGDRIYILPTRFGIYFLVVIFILFVLALSFGNALALFASIFFASIAMTSAIYTHFNLEKIVLKGVMLPDMCFAGENAAMEVVLENGARKRRFGVRGYIISNTRSKAEDIASMQTGHLTLPFQFEKRGIYSQSRLGVETDYPFGIFRSWRYFDINFNIEVAPTPKGDAHLPPSISTKAIETDTKSNTNTSGGEFFSHHSPYLPGDNYRDIDWKAYAREKGLLKKEFETTIPSSVELSNEGITHLEYETQLKQLSAWVLKLHNHGIPYSLKLEGTQVTTGLGLKQLKKCLGVLAAAQHLGEVSHD